MSEWINKGTELTESFDDRQGTDVTLDETHRAWSLAVTRVSGNGATLGIWGVDSSGRDAMIYHGPCTTGQRIPVGIEYRNVRAAVNLVRDEPPVTQRWSILGAWYRQSLRPGSVELEKWVFR
jgi:hypothetical protein